MAIEKFNSNPINNSLPNAANEAGALSLEISDINNIRKKAQIKKSEVDVIAKGLAEIAFSLGQTNNPDEFSATLAEDIVEALKKVKRRQEEKRKRQQS